VSPVPRKFLLLPSSFVMSSRVDKHRRRQKTFSLAVSETLLLGLLSRSAEMPFCSSCERSTNPSRCRPSPGDPSRCSDCVRLHRANCDILGPSHDQFLRVARQHESLEAELDAAEE